MSYDKILVPISGKLEGRRAKVALEHAIKLVKKEIILLHAYAPLPSLIGGKSHENIKKESHAIGLEILGSSIEILKQKQITFRTNILEGNPAESIIHVALEEKCDLIIMFTDGEDTFTDFLLGTITERVLRNTNANLLAIRSQD